MIKEIKNARNETFSADVIIVGAGPVGLFAAFQAGLLGMTSIIVDALEQVGGQLSALYGDKYIYDIPAIPAIRAKDLVANLAQQTSAYGPTLLLQQTADQITKEGNIFTVLTSAANKLQGKAVIIAAGAGSFKAQPLGLPHCPLFEGKSVFYSIDNPEQFCGKRVAILGGGDSAVDWALHLSDNLAAKVYLVHRRNHFRALPASLDQLKLRSSEEGSLELLVPYVAKELVGCTQSGSLTHVVFEHFRTKEKHTLELDYVLPFFGLARSLGGLTNWDLEINQVNSTIVVNPTTFETKVEGIFAVGDVAGYPHKLKLIMVGFSECANALHHAWKYVFPDKPFRLIHSTSASPPRS